ncbi:hypothetical protein [Rhodococcus daqingensis]|uniref:Uncharacterized protein n=1 Tax=Rhodococcus daqingensis TaxID=2479363 RepID=A0ABW2S321_9NOCA
MSKEIAGLGAIAVLAIIFYLTDVPAWAWAFPAVLLMLEVAMLVRARAIEARR